MDWVLGAIGGLMIGLAASIYLLGNGRIMGASGIVGGILSRDFSLASKERALFLLGLIGAPAVVGLFKAMPQTNATTSLPLLIAAGLLVGFGTRLGSGCTSGHGVCGMSRLSMRSIISTLIYIGAGVLTIIVARSLGVL